MGTNRKYSDIDIAYFGDAPILRIHGDFDCLNTIYTCDVLCYDTLKNQSLRDHIDRVGKQIYPALPASPQTEQQ